MTSYYMRSSDFIYQMDSITLPKPQLSPEVAHHILVVDRSGSMYGDIEKLKMSIEQALTVDSVTSKSDTLTTLISFSSSGDVTLHWSKVPTSKVLDAGQPYVKQLRGIRATYLTGISQGLHLALSQVITGQTTGITLFTDGYANDPSPRLENEALDAFVKKAKQVPGVFLNCIGYRSWCDWPRMKSMTNALSGETIEAKSFTQVLEVLNNTQKLLAGGVQPAIEIPAKENNFVLSINRTLGQVNVSPKGEGLRLSGLSDSDQVEAWYVDVLPNTNRGPREAKALPKEEMWRQAALISALVTNLDLREAKELLFHSGNKTLWQEHQSALTPSSLSMFQTDLSLWVMSGSNDSYEMGRNVRPKFTLYDLAKAFNGAPAGSLALDTNLFYAAYKRRSEKRKQLSNVRTKTGTVFIRGMSFNSQEATVQLETVAQLALLNDEGQPIMEVEKISLSDLKEFRSYTIMSSGERTVYSIPVEIVSKQGIPVVAQFIPPAEARKLKVGSRAQIELNRFGTSQTLFEMDDIKECATGLQMAAAQLKFFSAALDKEASSIYSPAQLAALKQLHLTPALYFSPPSETPFADRQAAVAKGYLDSYTRYKVSIGNQDILNASAFRSGNDFLKTFYTVTVDGQEVKAPKLKDVYYNPKATFTPKKRKGEDKPSDKLMLRVFEARLNQRMTADQVANAHKQFKNLVESTYDDLSPLVLEIGCTGLLPAHLAADMKQMTPEDYEQAYNVKLGKAEKEGMFFIQQNAKDGESAVVISIVPEVSWYTTPAGIAALG